MKTILLLLVLSAQFAYAQTAERVTVTLKNNGLLPRHFKFLEKRPGTPDNVFTTFLLPGMTYKVGLKVGTSLAQVNQQEIYASMRGLDVSGKLLLTVTPDDAGKTINLIQKKAPVKDEVKPKS